MRKPALSPVVKAWVRRLRSGKIKQAHYQLAVGDARCCLGVLCDLAVEKGVINSYNRAASYLPKAVAAWAGVRTQRANYGEGMALWMDNDRRGATLKKIANIIVSQPKGLFNAKA